MIDGNGNGDGQTGSWDGLELADLTQAARESGDMAYQLGQFAAEVKFAVERTGGTVDIDRTQQVVVAMSDVAKGISGVTTPEMMIAALWIARGIAEWNRDVLMTAADNMADKIE